MSLQDEIFDLLDALKDKPLELENLGNILSSLNHYEESCDRLSRENESLRNTIKILSSQ